MKVLIAEDNPMWSMLLEQNTRQWKYEPVMVEDGAQALKKLQEDSSICLAILDWQMPNMMGIEVCKQIKQDVSRPFTFVMMLTNRDSKEDMIEGLDAGADDYLTKPVDMGVLKSRLRAARRIIEAIPPRDWMRPQIEGYEVKRSLGKGAFATVWEAVRESDGESVAIKVLRVDLASEAVFSRFAQEIKIMQSLKHPYITEICESRLDAVVGYYVMERIRGGTLTDYEREKQPSGTERIDLMRRVLEGLHYAHEKGVIHRDLKFNNVMVTEDGIPKLVDFGMSKSLFQASESVVSETLDGSVIGTPLFMSPEQASGQMSQVDGRSDQYSAATMLYILLLKHHPHAIETKDYKSIIQKISRGRVRLPRSIKPDFNPELESILMRALEKRPEDRFPNAGEFAKALSSFLENRSG